MPTRSPALERLEPRDVPAHLYAVGTDPGVPAVARLIDGNTGATLATFLAYAPEFSGGVAVAAGDLDGDGRDDVITAPGPGGGPHVRAVSLAVNPAAPAELLSFFAYAPDFRGGTYLATGDVDSDGVTDIVTGTGPGGGCAVEAFRGSDAAPTGPFFAGDPADRGGVQVGVLDGTTIRAAVPTATGEAANLFTGSGQPLGPSDTAAGMVAGPAVAATNPAVLWNQVTLAAVQADRTLPPKVARDFAILHAAIFD